MSDDARIRRPEPSEAHPSHYAYIDQVVGDDILSILGTQLAHTIDSLTTVSEEASQYRYDPEKWSMRQVLGHISDTERIFTFRALWFARAIEGELLSFDQEAVAAANAEADNIAWEKHIEEFRRVRLATLSLFENLPLAAWSRSGISAGSRYTVRALAFITAGHLAHHLKILHERYRIS